VSSHAGERRDSLVCEVPAGATTCRCASSPTASVSRGSATPPPQRLSSAVASPVPSLPSSPTSTLSRCCGWLLWTPQFGGGISLPCGIRPRRRFGRTNLYSRAGLASFAWDKVLSPLLAQARAFFKKKPSYRRVGGWWARRI
jgi:hypothetical protein